MPANTLEKPSLETKIYANAFNSIAELGPVSLYKILKFFKYLKLAWAAKESEFFAAGLSEKQVQAILRGRKALNPEQLYDHLSKLGISTIIIGENNYPAILAEIPSPPPILYIRGDEKIINQPILAIVGTRKMTSYGKHVTEQLVSELSRAGLTIVSGLAFGVDATALNCIQSLGGKPIAVLASALDNNSISPRTNYMLAQKIIEQGCLVSEYTVGTAVQKQNFPIRNRIIAGLALGTLVVEADEESGSLITAQHALDFNREVFAVPGSIFSEVSRGTHKLIKQGAKLVSSSNDIIEELNLDLTTPIPPQIQDVSSEESQLLEILSREPVHIDDLIKQLNLTAAAAFATLTILEMKGRIKNIGGGSYIKIR